MQGSNIHNVHAIHTFSKLWNFTGLDYWYKIRRCNMIANEINIHQIPKVKDIGNCRPPYDLGKWTNYIPFTELLAIARGGSTKCETTQTIRLLDLYKPRISIMKDNNQHSLLNYMFLTSRICKCRYGVELLVIFV